MDYEYVNSVNINNSQNDRKEEIPIYQQNNSPETNTIYSDYVDMDPHITFDLKNTDISYYYDPQSDFLTQIPNSKNRIFNKDQLDFLINKYELPEQEKKKLYQELNLDEPNNKQQQEQAEVPKELNEQNEIIKKKKKYWKNAFKVARDEVNTCYGELNDLKLDLNLKKEIIELLQEELDNQKKNNANKILLNVLPIIFSLILVALSFFIKKEKNSRYIFGVGLLGIFISILLIILSQMNVINV